MASRTSLVKDQRFNTGFMRGTTPQMAYCREVLLRNRNFDPGLKTITYVVEGIKQTPGVAVRVANVFERIKDNKAKELETLILLLVGPVLKCLYPRRAVKRPKLTIRKTEIYYGYSQEKFEIHMEAPFSPLHVWEMHMILGLLRYVVTLYGSEKTIHREIVEELLAKKDELNVRRKDSCLRWISDNNTVYKMFSTVCGARKFGVFFSLLEHGDRPSYLGRTTYWDGVACASIRRYISAEGKVA